MGRSVDDGVIRPVLGGGFQNIVEDGRLRGDDDGAFLSPAVVPSFRAGLRVEVDDDDLLASGLGSAREVDREALFCPRPPSAKRWTLFS